MIVLHIGYAKSGTTSLQQSFFPNLAGCTYIPRNSPLPGTDAVAPPAFILSDMIHLDNEATYAEEAAKYSAIINRINSAGTTILSHENILRPYKIERIAHRLLSLFEDMDPVVVFTVRRQADIIASRLFHDWPPQVAMKRALIGGALQDNEVECKRPACNHEKVPTCFCANPGPQTAPPPISLPYYDYDRVVAVFEAVFGPDRVRVWPFEGLTGGRQDDIARIAETLRLEPEAVRQALSTLSHQNRGADRKKETTESRRKGLLGLISAAIMREPGGSAGKNTYPNLKKRLYDGFGDALEARFAAGNAGLSARYGLHLDDLGY